MTNIMQPGERHDTDDDHPPSVDIRAGGCNGALRNALRCSHMGVEQTVSIEANNRGWDRWILSTYNKIMYRDMAGKRKGTDTKIPKNGDSLKWRLLYNRKKKRYSCLSGGCAIIITTGKCAIVITSRKKKVLVTTGKKKF